jgi:hypothetical protein
MKLWPFSIAASKSLDYQFVTCPNFLEASSSLFTIKSRMEIDDRDPTRVRTMIFPDPKLGDIAFAYRTGPVEVDGEFERDSVGRVLLYAAGVVARGTPDDSSQPAIFEALRFFEDQLQRSLTEFLASRQKWIPRPAEGGEFPQGLLNYPPEPTYPTKRLPDKFLMCLGAAVALLFGLLVWVEKQVTTLSAQHAALSAQHAEMKKYFEQSGNDPVKRELPGHRKSADAPSGQAEPSPGNDRQPGSDRPQN